MKNILTTLYRTAFDPSVYREILEKSLKLSLAYFLFFYALISIALGLHTHFTRTPSFIRNGHIVLDSIIKNYPDDLVLTLENDQLTTNTATTSATTIPLLESVEGKTNAVIIDTNTYAESIENVDTLSIFTSNALAFLTSSDTADYLLIPYDQSGLSGSLNQAKALEYATQGKNTLNALEPAAPYFIILITFITLTIARFIFILLYTMLIQFAGSLFKRPFSYEIYLKLSLHTVVLSEIIHQLNTNLYALPIPSLFSLSFLGITLIALFSLPQAIRIRLKKPKE